MDDVVLVLFTNTDLISYDLPIKMIRSSYHIVYSSNDMSAISIFLQYQLKLKNWLKYLLRQASFHKSQLICITIFLRHYRNIY